MKAILLGMFLSLGLNASATDICKDVMPCGIYEGEGHWYDINNKQLDKNGFPEKISISKVDATTVNVKVVIGGGQWTDANLAFEADGHFVLSAVNDGRKFGTGYCLHQVCTIAFKPVLIEEKNKMAPFVNAFVNVLHFEGNILKRYNMIADGLTDDTVNYQRSTLTKK